MRFKSTQDVPETIPFFNRGQSFRNRVAGWYLSGAGVDREMQQCDQGEEI